ncbi:MAG: TolC family protein [Chryseobacterium sp.]|nr:TolC family protein [Chryseobacterium sp.]
MKKYIKIFVSVAFLYFSYMADAQEIDTLFTKRKIDYPTYIGLVGKNNLEYSAEKFNINIAEANILRAKIFPDPELGFGYADNGQRRMGMGYGFSSQLSWTLELGGKRKARIDLAKNEAQLTNLLLEDYFRNLRADATLAYLLTIQNRHLLDVQLNSYQQMKKLAEADSIRFKLGSITQVDARQSKLEAGTMLNEVYEAEAELKTALANLSLLTGQKQMEALFYTQEEFTGFDRNFVLQDLIPMAQNNRADLKAALQSKNISQSMIKLAKANRAIDLGLSVGAGYNSYVRNIIAPTPSFTTVNAGISIPLKFSNNRPGELRAAQYGALQAEQLYKKTELTIETEVTQAFYTYKAAQKQVLQFNTGLLAEAKAIMDGKIYSYQRGETSLLEVLNAQRTYNDVQQNYYQTLYSHAAALVELERAAGIWDINF